MIKSLRVFAFALAAAAVFCMGAVAYALEPIARAAKAGVAMFKDLVLDGFKLFQTSVDLSPVSIRIAQAKAFVLRLMKRERPVVTASWRMCPSI